MSIEEQWERWVEVKQAHDLEAIKELRAYQLREAIVKLEEEQRWNRSHFRAEWIKRKLAEAWAELELLENE